MALFEMNTRKLPSNLLSERFIVPPFSVFDTKQGYWQEKKRDWRKIGIKSELGRGDNLTYGDGADNNLTFSNSSRNKFGKCLPESTDEKYGRKAQATSIFDPLLCEIAYRWFSVDGARVLDPFAGGSVRGIVAGALGRHYTGVDLSEQQIEANKAQYMDISSRYDGIIEPNWIHGDSTQIQSLVAKEHGTDEKFDIMFSCPPYYDLEVYSDKENDLSNMGTYEEFLESYREIIKNSCELLKDDSFAIFVVGDMRDKTGGYRNFVGDTAKAFMNCGLKFYNEAIILNVAGSLPVRAPLQFNASRKLGKQHQNFLVFYKGDPSHIKDKFGSFEGAE